MEKFLSTDVMSAQIKAFSQKIVPLADLKVAWTKVWGVFRPYKMKPGLDRFSGGSNGNLVSYFEKKVGATARTIILYNHKFEEIEQVTIEGTLKDVFHFVTSSDYLICLCDRNNICTLEIYFHGRKISSVTIDNDERIINAAFWDTGVVFITQSNDVWYLPHFAEPRKLSKIETNDFIYELKVIPPQYTTNEDPIVFAFGYSNVIYCCVDQETQTITTPYKMRKLAFNSTYEYAAFVTDEDKLFITSSQFDETYAAIDIMEELDQILDVHFLGGDLTMISYSSFNNDAEVGGIHIYTADGFDQDYSFSGTPIVFQNQGNALVFGDRELYTLSLISPATNNALGDSSEPARVLLDAVIKKDARKVIELKKSDKLYEAIEEVIEAAQYATTDVKIQKALLQAASFGAAFSQDSGANIKFCQITQQDIEPSIRLLRVMAEMRKELSIVMFARDLKEMQNQPTPSLKFCQQGKHALAHKIARYLQTDSSPIVTDWCCCVIKALESDDDAIRAIRTKREHPGFNPTAIAVAAHGMHREALSLEIAKMEGLPANLVGFYVNAGDWPSALRMAAASADTVEFVRLLERAREAVGDPTVTQFLGDCIQGHRIVSKIAQYGAKSDLHNLLLNVPEKPGNAELSIRDRLISTDFSRQEPIKSFENQMKALKDEYTKKSTDGKVPAKALSYIDHAADYAEYLSKNLEIKEKLVQFGGKNIVKKSVYDAMASILDKEKPGDSRERLVEALKIAKKAGLKPKRAMVNLIRHSVDNGDPTVVEMIVTDKDYQELRLIAAAAIACKRGQADAIAYVRRFQDPKLVDEMIPIINELFSGEVYFGSGAICNQILFESSLLRNFFNKS